MQGQLRVAVIGSQTCHADSPQAYTVYRTSVNLRGLCYHRLIRYRHFLAFAKRLKLAPDAPRISVKLPPKLWWSRKASLQPETVEQRQVLLNEFMQQVCTRQLTLRSEERLLKLLQVGDYAPEDEEDRVINSRLSIKQRSATPTEATSEIMERNASLQTAALDEEEEASNQVDDSSLTYEEHVKEQQDGACGFHREDSDASTNPASEDLEIRAERSLSAPLAPPLQVTTRPVSMSLSSQYAKRVLFGEETDVLALKEGGRDSIGSASDYVSTPERHYFGLIKNCIFNIEGLLDSSVESSRKLEVRIRDKQTANW
ncbi:hypothetical protein KRP22_004886 [Phytophthora ramorum]|uniref:PX domain-containing protein n=1 Tax=Phytophthora ramorum TaxID=164328 RepID=H3GSQ8_PHYRM|nr:hypothetical protein KRP23_13485 [Phytophthora ramorum]KAH7497407.1 hypothetical protein KRP22_12470 [Phytophthora ramorum]